MTDRSTRDKTIVIDGAEGEGGGQVLRTSLALSAITGRPLRLERIRARRPKPGLMRQHLTAVHAAAAVCGAHVAGAEVGASALEFVPGPVKPGDYEFKIGTAGSTTLVLQTVLPILMLADGASTVALEGGTHNPFAPTADFLRGSFLAALGRCGATVDVQCERHGFFPVGGGRLVARIEPWREQAPLELIRRGAVLVQRATALVSSLPGEIAAREIATLRERLGWDDSCLRIESLRGDRDHGPGPGPAPGPAPGPGNVVTIEIDTEHAREVFASVGERGVSAERVANRAADAALAWLSADVPVGPHLADQLMLPLALRGRGAFVTMPLTSHSTTNLAVIERFLGTRLNVVEEGPGRIRVEAVEAAGASTRERRRTDA